MNYPQLSIYDSYNMWRLSQKVPRDTRSYNRAFSIGHFELVVEPSEWEYTGEVRTLGTCNDWRVLISHTTIFKAQFLLA
ncbi:hypothetical protein EPI10_005441 [Gossypium australe]|uniref:Uncharacterized protein n=1 Tax=Gossypium australe TaxID=47621 RepID=A0A5B6WR04_9ROSI|nr:hypothetical protein EPI10_005441 [Gossypium australe]